MFDLMIKDETVSIKNKVISNLFWKILESSGTQAIQLIVQIVLARLLMPSDFGIITTIIIFTTIANVFIQSGFSTALIQKKDANDTDFSSVFYLNLIVASILFWILFFAAPFISIFYKEPQLIPVLRVLSITLFFGALNSIQNAIVARRMQFKILFISSLGAILTSGTVGILLAYYGFGVWALICQQITNQFVISIILFFTIRWRPKLLFSFRILKSLFSYGWKLLASSLIDNLYMNLYNLIVGKMYNSQMLGFFNRGQQLPSLIVTNINGSIQSVIFPALTSQQDDKQKVKAMVRRSIVTSSFILFPIMAGIIVIAKSLIKVLLTEKWLPSVPFLQIYCVIYALWPIHTANLQAINALGRSDIFLKLEFIKKVIGFLILGITVFYGVYAIALGGIISGIISMVINSYPNKRLLNYDYKEQCIDIMPSLILSIVMGFVTYCISFLRLNDWILLLLQIISGMVLYIGMEYFLRLECF